MRSVAVFVWTAGYSGLVPIAPGTAGSLVGLGLLALVRAVGDRAIEAALVVAVVSVGVWAGSQAERHYGRGDPGAVVIDEVAGMLITLFWIPVGWEGGAFGFVAFRAFDIVKPFPAGAAERLPGGWGIMADDIVAGLYAYATVRALGWAMPALVAS